VIEETESTNALRDVMERYPELTIDGLGGDRRPNLEWRRAAICGKERLGPVVSGSREP
jgi:hypothetical protein